MGDNYLNWVSNSLVFIGILIAIASAFIVGLSNKEYYSPIVLFISFIVLSSIAAALPFFLVLAFFVIVFLIGEKVGDKLR